MKLKSLLFMVTLLLCCLGVKAQSKVVFEEHFVAEPTDPSAVGFYEFINNEEGDERSIDSSEGALFIFNADGTLDSDSWWRRAIKFRNLDLSEGKIYRLEFGLKGSNRYEDGVNTGDARPRCKASVQLLQGEDDFDISLLDYNGAEQRGEFQYFSEDEYGKYTQNFYFASEALQKEKYAEKGKGELADKYFLSLSVFNPGMFFLKDVVLKEVSAVNKAEFGEFVVKVEFNGSTNIADLARADEKGLVFFDDLSFATVKAGNEVMEIEAIEYHSDGCLYIFTVDAIEAEGGVVVSFTNPTDDKQIKFKGTVESPATLFDFAGEEVTYNDALDGVLSYLYQAPELVSSYPQDRAFAIEESLSEFTFTFDRPVSTALAKGVLSHDGQDIELIVKEGQGEYVETITFVRNDNGLLGKNNTIVLDDIFSEQDIEKTEGYKVTFEAGKPQIAKETITPVQIIDFSTDDVNTIPLGWTLRNDINDDNPEGELRPSGSTQGSGPRLFHYQLGDYQTVFYVRSNVSADKNGYTTATYGDMEDYGVKLPAGMLHIDFLASGYKAAGQKVRCEILSLTGDVIASLDKAMEEVTPDGGPAAQEKLTIEYNNPAEQDVIIRYTVFGDGMKETMLSAVIVNTYEKTEGETPDDQTIFADASYGGAGNNRTPKAESGWELWQGGERRAPDTDFNYNGTRIFNDLALKGLKVGYYCNGQWPNGYVLYGSGELEGAPKLTLPAGSLDITYYAANWKVNEAREIHFQILNSEGASLVDNVTYTSPVNMDGNRGATYEADKFTFSFDCPEAGDYMIKLGSPAGETFMGNISIVKPGSRAVKFYSLLAAAVESAQAALAKCEDAMYDGATKTALTEAIEKYEDQSKITMTTEEEFNAAIAELNALEKSMLTRYEYIPRFNQAVSNAEGLYAGAIGTKFEKLECYVALEETLMKYNTINPSDLEDAELIASTTDLENYSTLFTNMKDKGVGFLTKQIVDAAAQLVEMDIDQLEDPYVTAANEAITDDQDIAYQLKLRLTKAIYDQCAEGDPFNIPVYDPETGEPIPGEYDKASISAANFIQNGIFYVSGLTVSSRDMQATDEIPGWTINKIRGNVGYEFSWVSWDGSEFNPVKNVIMINGWNTELVFSQEVSELPVGKYRLIFSTQDRGFEDNGDAKKAELETRPHWTVTGTNGTESKEGEEFSYIFWQKGGDQNMTPFDISQQGQWYGFTDCQSVDFEVTDDGEATGSVTIGAHMFECASTASLDNARLVMVGKVEGYDYAAAAAKIAERIGSQGLKGDVNGDGIVNGTDIQAVINCILAGEYDEKADVNKDNVVNGTDIQEIINIILRSN
jgi:hypothetical protein